MLTNCRTRKNEKGAASTWLIATVLFLLLIAVSIEWFARSSTTFVQLLHPSSLLEGLKVGGDFLTEYDKEKGRRLIPNAKVMVRNHYLSKLSVAVEINSLGFRDTELPKDKREGERRILVLGDSVTISDYLPANESYVEQLQRALRKGMPESYMEVINAGISDIGLSEQMGILRERGLATNPDYVLVGFYLNDSLPPWGFAGKLSDVGPIRRYSVAANSVYRALKLREWIQGDYAKRFQWIEAKEKLDWRSSRDDFEKLVNLARYDWGAAWTDDSWKVIRKHFEELNSLSREHGFKVIVVALPVIFQVEAEFIDDSPQRRLEELSAEQGFLFFDTLPKLREHAKEDLYYDQCHYTAHGNQLVGSMLSDFFLEQVFTGQT